MGLFLKVKNHFLKITFLFLLAALLCPSFSYAVPADVTDISDNKYFDVVHSSLEKAKDSIYVSLYGIIVGEHDKLSLPYILLQDLINAHKRGVKVIVRLDRSYDYLASERTGEFSQRNEVAYMMLTESGIDCKFTISDKTLHDKLIVIDGETVIEGSMNWSTSALRLNRESVSLIKSEEYAKEKIQRIDTLEITGEEHLDRAQIETVPIRNKFLRDPSLAGRMVRNRDLRGFDMYLVFLKDFNKTGKARFELDYERIAKCFGMDLSRRRYYRYRINKVLRRLRDKYKLIDCEFITDKPAQITLLDYEDTSKEYQAPQIGYFKVPLAYWEYSWSRKLDLRSKFCYLINLYRTEFSEIKPWWSLPLDLIAEDFNVNKWTVMRGMRDLKKLGLLDVEYDSALNEEGKFSGREPNKYRIKLLLSQEEIDKKWRELENIYGEELIEKARGFAFMIEQGNNIEKVEDFIRIMGRYTEEWVEKATKITARMRVDNPSRNFGYIMGILKRWDRQGYMD